MFLRWGRRGAAEGGSELSRMEMRKVFEMERVGSDWDVRFDEVVFGEIVMVIDRNRVKSIDRDRVKSVF